ncbi:MAG: RimK family alpha-L-glutamate ligase [Bacteroidota bacterium]
MKLVILKNEIPKSEERWVKSCEKKNISHSIVDLTCVNWLELILSEKPDLLLARPSGLTAPFKILYDERLEILVNELKIPCFPTLGEVKIYENKKYFSYWLKANDLPHPQTNIFYFEQEAIKFCEKQDKFPLVAKSNIGASGSGVIIIESKTELLHYIKQTFNGTGAQKRVGPNLKKGKLIKRAVNLMLSPKKIIDKYAIYKARALDIQRDFVLFQEYIPHEFEWRVVCLGDSFFAHKKLLSGEMTSGSLLKDYGNPPLELLDFVKELTDKFNFKSMAVDLFETSPTEFLINEMQCIFGQSDAFQMKVDGIIGRYIHSGDKWVFEAGDFNTNESYDLRLEAAIDYYQSIKNERTFRR